MHPPLHFRSAWSVALASAQVRLHWLEAKPWIVCTLGLRKASAWT